MTREDLYAAACSGDLVLTRSGVLGPVDVEHRGGEFRRPETWTRLFHVPGFVDRKTWRGVNRMHRVDGAFTVEPAECRLVSDAEIAEAQRRLTDRRAPAGSALAAALMRRQRRLRKPSLRTRGDDDGGVWPTRLVAVARARVAGVLRQAAAWRRRCRQRTRGGC